MDTLLEALNNFKPEPPKKSEPRLYYDAETGKVIAYTMEDLGPSAGPYIVVEPEIFAAARYDVIIKNNKIEYPKTPTIAKLVPSKNGKFGTMLYDFSLVGDEIYWRLKTYE